MSGDPRTDVTRHIERVRTSFEVQEDLELARLRRAALTAPLAGQHTTDEEGQR